jgi:hypothetical protein
MHAQLIIIIANERLGGVLVGRADTRFDKLARPADGNFDMWASTDAPREWEFRG